MRQSHSIAVATQYQGRTAVTIETIAARSQLPSFVEEIVERLVNDFEQLGAEQVSATDIAQRWFATTLSFAAFDNVPFQWQSAYLDDEGR